ncbi:MAG: nicotinate phosphoribosyltransferase [Candidatus Nanopelagicales bacterium]
MLTSLLTDQYELTMIDAARQAGTAERACVFELFGRRLSGGRRYGVVAGTGRLLDEIASFQFGPDELEFLQRRKVVSADTLAWLADYRFTGDIYGYAEGEVYFPGSPILRVEADFQTGVVVETLALSILNHDCAIATAASRMWVHARGRRLIEMGSRRTHELAAIAAARAAYIAGFDTTSNLAAGRIYGIPTAGTAAHAFTLLHDDEPAAFAAQVAALGRGTTLLVDTYDVRQGIVNALEAGGPELGAIRLDSGDLADLARAARKQLDAAGNTGTKIVVTSDLDEHAIAALDAAPVDIYGVGTSLVTGSGVPTAGLVYKVVEVDGRFVAKKSAGEKSSVGGEKRAVRQFADSGVALAELVGPGAQVRPGTRDRDLVVPLVLGGERVSTTTLDQARARHAESVAELPMQALSLQPGDPVLPTLRV